MLTETEIKENIEKLRNKIGDARTGGKGSQRRKVKVVAKQNAGNDKIVKNIIKKVGAHQLGVDEINFFKDDGTILHFRQPEAYASIQNNTFIVTGDAETKTLKELIPDIIPQLGAKQNKILKEFVDSVPQGLDEPPALVYVDAPKVEESKAEAPKAEYPKAEASNAYVPKSETPVAYYSKPDNLNKVD